MKIPYFFESVLILVAITISLVVFDDTHGWPEDPGKIVLLQGVKKKVATLPLLSKGEGKEPSHQLAQPDKVPSPWSSHHANRDNLTTGSLRQTAVSEPSYVSLSQAELGEILAPYLSYKLSASDNKNVAKVIRLIVKKKFTAAHTLRKKIRDPYAGKLVDWYGRRKRWKEEPLEVTESYRLSHLDWPGMKDLRRTVEASLLRDKSSLQTLQKFFAKSPAISGPGKFLQAKLKFSKKKKAEAKEFIRTVWREDDFSQSVEILILTDYGHFLTHSDHLSRAHRLLYSGKKSALAAVRRVAKRLNKDEQKKIKAHIAVLRRTKNAGRLLKALSAEAKKDLHVLFSRATHARRKKQKKIAWTLHLAAPPDGQGRISPDAWWTERRILVREALYAKAYQDAYQLAKTHGPVSVNHYNEAEFLAGWIALRYLKKPELSGKHFEALRQSADGPRSRSRSYYWLGRTAQALDHLNDAQYYFEKGAQYFNTFYGQMSRKMANPAISAIKILSPAPPTEEEKNRFLNRDVIYALTIAHKSKQRKIATFILGHLRKHLKAPGELLLLAELAKRFGYPQQSLRIGKSAMFFGHPFADYAYPTDTLPKFKPLRSLPEQAFVYGIARQESEFNKKIVSRAGASGLMQVMPITARHVAQDHKIKYRKSRLISDPAYNMMIGSTYIADRMDDFSGSYVMALASYNAGPGRVREWVRLLGDPRQPSVDPIDWIERIPFDETRNYVKKVLANVQIYRARLGHSENALKIIDDLNRGRL